MSGSNELIINKINDIKYKLNKYINLKENNKIRDYLNVLNNFEKINYETLKATLIVDCLKQIKKKGNCKETSQLASNVISKWKIIVESSSKQDEARKSLSTNNKSINDKSQSVNTKSNTDKTKSMSNLNEIESKKSNEIQPPDFKKSKLSLNDYKFKKEINNYEVISDQSKQNNVNLNKTSSNNNIVCASKPMESIKIEKEPTLVPLPTVPLSNILSPNNFNSINLKFSSTNNSSSNRNNFNSFLVENEDDALARIMSAKHSKRVLYTGKANANSAKLNVPKLFDLSIKSLVSSLDELPSRIYYYNMAYNSPGKQVAFDLIKPVLEKANAEQLKSIEYYSPYLSDETEYLWQKCSEKEFKKFDEGPDEDENWRDFYHRKIDERELALKRTISSITSKQANKPQKRQTQIATVKFVSNPPSSRQSAASQHSTTGNKSKPIVSNSSVPVRAIIKDGSSRLVSNGAGGACGGLKKTAQSAPSMSQGMKAVNKLIKRNMRR